MKFAVTIVSPTNYVHSEAFAEIGEAIHFGLRALGHESVLSRKWVTDKGRRTIVLGANILAALKAEPPPNSVLYNLEQVQTGSEWISPALLELYRRYPVWDYSEANIEALVSLGVPRPMLLPIGYVKQLTRIERRSEDLDVLFYGCINERRSRIIDQLRARGLKVEMLYAVYGAQRDAYIARSRLVLNVHYYEAKVFEAVRVSYLLANRRAVVSESGRAPSEEHAFASGVAFAPYDQLVSRCVELVQDEAARTELGEAGFRLMTERDEASALRGVLAQTIQKRGQAA